jgi:hypothetical protein
MYDRMQATEPKYGSHALHRMMSNTTLKNAPAFRSWHGTSLQLSHWHPHDFSKPETKRKHDLEFYIIRN